MESRRIVLLTEGFLKGWLSFDNKTPLSQLREEIILVALERLKASEVAANKTILDASIASGNLTQDTIKLAYESYEQYLGLSLPYGAKKVKMKDIDETLNSAQDIAFFKKLLNEKKKLAKELESNALPV